MNDSFTRSPKVILDHFKVDSNKGLSPAQVSAGLDKYGKNGMCYSHMCSHRIGYGISSIRANNHRLLIRLLLLSMYPLLFQLALLDILATLTQQIRSIYQTSERDTIDTCVSNNPMVSSPYFFCLYAMCDIAFSL